MLVVNEEKDVLVHETEISVVSILIEERKEGIISKSRKHKRELEDLQAGVKYHKIYYTKKAKTEDEGEMFLPGKSWKKKRRKEFLKLFQICFQADAKMFMNILIKRQL